MGHKLLVLPLLLLLCFDVTYCLNSDVEGQDVETVPDSFAKTLEPSTQQQQQLNPLSFTVKHTGKGLPPQGKSEALENKEKAELKLAEPKSDMSEMLSQFYSNGMELLNGDDALDLSTVKAERDVETWYCTNLYQCENATSVDTFVLTGRVHITGNYLSLTPVGRVANSQRFLFWTDDGSAFNTRTVQPWAGLDARWDKREGSIDTNTAAAVTFGVGGIDDNSVPITFGLTSQLTPYFSRSVFTRPLYGYASISQLASNALQSQQLLYSNYPANDEFLAASIHYWTFITSVNHRITYHYNTARSHVRIFLEFTDNSDTIVQEYSIEVDTGFLGSAAYGLNDVTLFPSARIDSFVATDVENPTATLNTDVTAGICGRCDCITTNAGMLGGILVGWQNTEGATFIESVQTTLFYEDEPSSPLSTLCSVTPTPTPGPIPSATATPTPTITPTLTITPTITATPSPTPTKVPFFPSSIVDFSSDDTASSAFPFVPTSEISGSSYLSPIGASVIVVLLLSLFL